MKTIFNEELKSGAGNSSSLNVDVVFTLIAKGVDQIIIKLPKAGNGKDPQFFYNTQNIITAIDTPSAIKTVPAIVLQTGIKKIYGFLKDGASNYCTVDFEFSYLEVTDFAQNPHLEIDLIKNPFVNNVPYLEIEATHIKTDRNHTYYPYKGATKFGKQTIDLLQNQD